MVRRNIIFDTDVCRIFLSFCIARVCGMLCVIRVAGEYCGPDKYNIVIPLQCYVVVYTSIAGEYQVFEPADPLRFKDPPPLFQIF